MTDENNQQGQQYTGGFSIDPSGTQGGNSGGVTPHDDQQGQQPVHPAPAAPAAPMPTPVEPVQPVASPAPVTPAPMPAPSVGTPTPPLAGGAAYTPVPPAPAPAPAPIYEPHSAAPVPSAPMAEAPTPPPAAPPAPPAPPAPQYPASNPAAPLADMGGATTQKDEGSGPPPGDPNYVFASRMKDFKTSIKLPAHQLSFDEDKFINLLAGSISLTKDEKKKIIDSVPKLRQQQVDELIRIFEEERAKFVELSPKHGAQLKKLEDEHHADWVDIEMMYKQEAKAGEEEKAVDDIKKQLGL